MSPRVDENELRRRAIEGVREEVEAFGSGAPDSILIRREGLIASIVPASPQRSLFNGVFYTDPAALAGELDSLEALYESHGVRAWTVWVPDADRETARLLASRGHALDAEPRAMAMELHRPRRGAAGPGGHRPRADRRCSLRRAQRPRLRLWPRRLPRRARRRDVDPLARRVRRR